MKGNSVADRMGLAMNFEHGYRRLAPICLAIFLCALGVRAFHWQDNPTPPFHGMTAEYKSHAMALVGGDLKGFLRGPDPPSDANVVKHPPGYPLLMALVYKISGNSDNALRGVHIFLDAIAALLVVLIALELFSFPVATLSGFLIALSPQLGYHANALLPDALAAPPLLLAIYFFIRATRRSGIWNMCGAGIFIGVSCWLRSNALLFPVFLAALIPFIWKRGGRWKQVAALFGGAVITILPVTIRNYLAFKAFIPLSLSAGITLVVGIGLFDKTGQFGLPATDIGVTQWEARLYVRPDYLCGRFAPDGVKRERLRIAKGFAVVRSHPLWFAGVMAHRAADMLRLTRVEIVAADASITQPADEAKNAAFIFTPEQTYQSNSSSPSLSLVRVDKAVRKINEPAVNCPNNLPPIDYLVQDWKAADAMKSDNAIRFSGEASRDLFVSPAFRVKPNTDYLIRFPLRIEEGSVRVEIVDAERHTTISSTPIIHAINWAELSLNQQPFFVVRKSFVSESSRQVQIVFTNGNRRSIPLTADAGQIQVIDLGPSSLTWTRYPRIVINVIQKSFITAIMLPFMLLGAGSLIYLRRPLVLALLAVLPAYYMCVQSALWTEFRYVMPMYYLLFILAAAGMVFTVQTLRRLIGHLPG